MAKSNTIDDIIKMLDSSVASGVGHLNIHVEETREEFRSIEQLGCLDCATGNLACNIPTLHKGIDDIESEYLLNAV